MEGTCSRGSRRVHNKGPAAVAAPLMHTATFRLGLPIQSHGGRTVTLSWSLAGTCGALSRCRVPRHERQLRLDLSRRAQTGVLMPWRENRPTYGWHSSSSIGDLDRWTLPSKLLKRKLAAREDDDLLILGHTSQGGEHLDDPVVIGKDQRVVQHDWHMATQSSNGPPSCLQTQQRLDLNRIFRER